MNGLLINTACGTQVLVRSGDDFYYKENNVNAGSEILMPLIDATLGEAGLALADIDVFGACVGPGSFTGLRIGLTTVKAFCYASGKPCFAVNNLRLLSYNNNVDNVIAVADAGNKVCYIAEFDKDAEILPCKCVTTDDAKAYIATRPQCKVSVDKKLKDAFVGTAGTGKTELMRAFDAHAHKTISYSELLPLYVRKAQPERGEGDL